MKNLCYECDYKNNYAKNVNDRCVNCDDNIFSHILTFILFYIFKIGYLAVLYTLYNNLYNILCNSRIKLKEKGMAVLKSNL